jgi:hypothetical protein
MTDSIIDRLDRIEKMVEDLQRRIGRGPSRHWRHLHGRFAGAQLRAPAGVQQEAAMIAADLIADAQPTPTENRDMIATIKAWIRKIFRRRRESNLVLHARAELTCAGLFDKSSDYGGMLGHGILAVVKEFSKEGHSGFSAGLAVSALEKLLRLQPLTPLTGDDGEWNDVAADLLQNKRCGRVFKEKATGRVYDIDGRVFRDATGCFTNSESRVEVTFPYVPKTEIVDIA